MDSYPKHLAPQLNKGGGVETPFDEWWPRVRQSFSNVPDDVAEQWLHRHWGSSPFGWLISTRYRFENGTLSSEQLLDIWNTCDDTRDDAIKTGQFRVTQKFWVRDYMVEHGTFPVPIIVLDNSDAHLASDADYPDSLEPRPWILVEGHRRYEVAVGLQQQGKLQPTLPIWWMRRTRPR